jgi:hypothetical protein
MPRTLILEPTRELAAQVEESFVKYGVNHKLNVALLIGGVSFADQEAKIMRGADVLIATPGRLLDFAERGKLLLTGIEILVIDEGFSAEKEVALRSGRNVANSLVSAGYKNNLSWKHKYRQCASHRQKSDRLFCYK